MCKYCRDDDRYDYIINKYLDFGVLGRVNVANYVHENKLIIFFYDGDEVECYERKIKYCPMCGRKLEGEVNGIT